MAPLDPSTALAVKKAIGSALAKKVLTSIGDALGEFHRRKGERAVEALVSALCDLTGLAPEEQAEALDRLLTAGEPGVPDPHEKLYETFRMFAATRTEAAWPHIARMTADYIEHKKAIDGFFRRVGWLLERCEAEDVAFLVAAFSVTDKYIADHRPEERPTTMAWYPPGGATLQIRSYPTTSPNVAIPEVTEFPFPRAYEVVGLLSEARLAHAGGAGMVNFREPDVLRRLIDLFRK